MNEPIPAGGFTNYEVVVLATNDRGEKVIIDHAKGLKGTSAAQAAQEYADLFAENRRKYEPPF